MSECLSQFESWLCLPGCLIGTKSGSHAVVLLSIGSVSGPMGGGVQGTEGPIVR